MTLKYDTILQFACLKWHCSDTWQNALIRAASDGPIFLASFARQVVHLGSVVRELKKIW